MIVVDVETTGVNPTKHGIVSLGAIDFSDTSRQFYGECRIWDGAHVMDKALAINGYTREQISDTSKKSEKELLEEFLLWMKDSPEHTLAGQNVFFDAAFLEQAAFRSHIDFTGARRIIDLHSIVYFHMIRRGLNPPTDKHRTNLNSDAIMEYVGLPQEPKPHIALNGAKWETEAFTRLMFEKPCFRELKKYKIPWLS